VFPKASCAAAAVLAASTLVLVAAPATAEGTQTLAAAVSARPTYRLGEPIALTVEVRNPGANRSVLVWDTPLEDLGALDYLRVRHGSSELAYDGPLFKRVRDASAYRVMQAGETVRRSVDLSSEFAFTKPGSYTVTLTSEGMTSASTTFEVLPGGPARRTTAETAGLDAAPRAEGAKFVNLSSGQRDQVRDAIGGADRYVDRADDTLAAHHHLDRYRTWFGPVTHERYQTVRNHYSQIGHGADDITYHGDCDKAGVYAYVYPSHPKNMWLCPAFWTAPMTGTDSKAGTLVHEQSHYTVNGGTQDYVYGQPACKALADDNPAKAIMNADSHEYYAENTPAVN
jgi:peptidyl-Lys metalloendopeptidase